MSFTGSYTEAEPFASTLEITGLELVDGGLLLLLSFGVGDDIGLDFVYSVF